MQIGNFEVFVDSITIASASNTVLRKRFLNLDTIRLIPNGVTLSHNYSKRALIWLLHMVQIDGVNIMHGSNCREYKVRELPTLV